MAIEKSFLYSIKDSEKITNIPKRTLSRYALENNNRKIDGRYLFLGSQLEELIEKRLKKKQKKENTSPTSRQNKTLATLKGNGEVVAKEEYDALKTENETLKDKLSEYDIADNERLTGESGSRNIFRQRAQRCDGDESDDIPLVKT